MIYSNNAECEEIFSLQSLFSTVQVENIPPKALIFSDFMLTFAMSLMILLVLICSTKVSEKSDMAKS